MKLQKLVFYCQAWSLVWDEAPLFEDGNFEAWANGPVCPLLYREHQGLYMVDKINGNPDNLNSTQLETIDKVLAELGSKRSQWLIDLTHMENPWIDARNGLSPTERGNTEITNYTIAEYYSAL